MHRSTTRRALAAAGALVALSMPAARGADSAVLDGAFGDLKAYDWGRPRGALTLIHEAVLSSHGAAAARADLEKRLAAVLATDATRPAKDFVCRELALVGTARSVPALAALLTDEDLSHMARYALDRIPGDAATEALREALGKTSGEQRIGVMNSVGLRGDRAAVPALAALLRDADADTAAVAAAALGEIGATRAAQALRRFRRKGPRALRGAAVDASFDVAERLLGTGLKRQAARIYDELYSEDEPEAVRIAAFQGLVAARPAETTPRLVELLAGEDGAMRLLAARIVHETPGQDATRGFASALPELPPAGQAALLEALGVRGDPAARQAVLSMVGSPDAKVRLAALAALSTTGSAADVAMLAEAGARGDADGEAARGSLTRLRGENVNLAIVAEILRAETGPRTVLVESLGARQAREAVPTLLEAAGDPEAAVRGAAFEALGRLADAGQAAEVVSLLARARDSADRKAAEKALMEIAGRTGAPCAGALATGLEGADVPSRCALLRVLGRAGGPKALAAARAAVKDADPDVKDAGVRVLVEWPDAALADEVLEIARSAGNVTHRVLALRGYVRMVGLLGGRSAEERLAMYDEAMAAASRPDERRLVLAGLAEVGHVKALARAEGYLDDDALRAEAAAAMVKIARAVGGAHRAEALAAIEKAKRASPSDELSRQAREAVDHMERFEDWVTSWKISGRYTKPGKGGKDLIDVEFAPEKPDADVKWKLWTGRGETPWRVDLAKFVGGEDCAAYLRARIRSPGKREARLELGSDDGIKVWLNGKVVHRNNASRGVTDGQDKPKVTLEEGWNDLLLKITQGGGGWGASARVRAADGAKIRGLGISAE